MKNLTLFLVMSLGLFVLGTFANSDTPKAMYKRLPLSFKDNGELRCPGSKIRGPRKDLLTKNLLTRFGITVATRFQDDPAREDSCIFFWVCSGFHTDSISIRGSCPFPEVFEPSKEKCVFYTDAKTNCNKYYAGEMTADEEFELKNRPKREADLKSTLVVDSQTDAKVDLLKETEQKLEKLGNLMAIWKIQPKLKVEKYIAQVEKIIAQRDKTKQKNVAELKAEEKLEAQREDWRKLIKIQKAWVKSNLN